MHNVHLARPEIDALRAGGARFVLCPRSNAAHGNGAPDVTHFVDAKIPFALGTDSLGSVPDLSLVGGDARRPVPVQGKEEGRRAVPGTVPGRHGATGPPPSVFPAGSSPRASRPISSIVDDPGGDGDRFFRELVEKTDRANVRLTVVAGQSAHGAAA